MNQHARTLQELRADRQAVAILEYGLIAALVVVMAVAAVSVMDLNLDGTLIAIGARS